MDDYKPKRQRGDAQGFLSSVFLKDLGIILKLARMKAI